MTKERLELLSDDMLLKLAEKTDIRVPAEWDRSGVIQLIVDAMEEERLERESLMNLALTIEAKKYSVSIDEELDLSFDVDEEMELPDRYNETMVHFLLRDNSWGFALWDIQNSVLADLELKHGLKDLYLRISEYEDEACTDDDLVDYFDIPVTRDERKRYINLPSEDVWYNVKIVARSEELERVVAESEAVRTFRDHVNLFPGAEPKLEKIVKLSGYKIQDNTGGGSGSNPHRIIQAEPVIINEGERNE